MDNNELYKIIVDSLKKPIRELIDESYGSIQYETEKNKGFIRLLSDIVTDIRNADNNKSYILKYENIIDTYGIKWLNNLTLEVKNNIFNNANAYALIEDKEQTKFTKHYIEFATILVNNPLLNKLLKSSIAHELNHYIKYFNVNRSNSKVNDSDLILSTKVKTLNLKYEEYCKILEKVELFKLNDFNIYAKLIAVYMDILYYCNKSEITAHMETIFGEFMLNDNSKSIKDIIEISPTCALYNTLKIYLELTLNTNNKDFIKFINIHVKPHYCNLTKVSFEKTVKRYINRINIFLSKAKKLYIQLKG